MTPGTPAPTEEEPRAPARVVLVRAEAANAALGHENHGFLSAAHGFMPTHPPRGHLPPPFDAWDVVAGALPRLYGCLGVRAALDELAPLEPEPGSLEDADLLRAVHVLGMLAHAYWYVETNPPHALPEGVARPWARVSQRLGRESPALSYVDLIVYNFRLIDGARPDPLRVENMRLLTPTVDTQEERVFYLTQTEILARATPLLEAVVRAQEAVLVDDAEALNAALSVVLTTLEAMQRSLRKIDARPSTPTHMHPVVWAKTVAPFAVPLVAGTQGPSGTSSPVFNLLDVFLGRIQHASFLGREIRELRQSYPPWWRAFLEAVAKVSVPEYVAVCRAPRTDELFRAVCEAYAGEGGFLGRHRRKVYGFLEMAFKVGRSTTIGGFSGLFHDRTWERVDDELEASRGERPAGAAPIPASPAEGDARPAATSVRKTGTSYLASDVITRNDGPTVWIVLEGEVHDVSAFRDVHPGGAPVIALHAGLDATKAFARAHRGTTAASALRERFRLGPLHVPDLPSGKLALFYERWLHCSYLVVEMQNALRCDIGLQFQVTAGGEAPEPRSAFKLQRALETQRRFIASYLGACSGPLFHDLSREAEGLCFGQSTDSFGQALAAGASRARQQAVEASLLRLEARVKGGAPVDGAGPAIIDVCETLERLATQTLADVKAILREGLVAFERHEARVLACAAARLPALLARLPVVLGDFYGEALATLAPFEP